MADYITIDGGTTNTRISFVKNYKVTDFLKKTIILLLQNLKKKKITYP